MFVALNSILGILALADVLFDDKKTNTTAHCSPQNVRSFRGGGGEWIIPVKFMSGLLAIVSARALTASYRSDGSA
jgi:hypothetical protein